jgi:hypothetical protein
MAIQLQLIRNRRADKRATTQNHPFHFFEHLKYAASKNTKLYLFHMQ